MHPNNPTYINNFHGNKIRKDTMDRLSIEFDVKIIFNILDWIQRDENESKPS